MKLNNKKIIIGESPIVDELCRKVAIVSSTDVTVLLHGETGTGKEMFTNAIQQNSSRANKPFIMVNCALLPEALVESEIFGHRKGSFTGAVSDKQGLFEAADGGTLFLDEINSLSLNVQAKILRFIDFGEFLPIGARAVSQVDVRVIAATNADLYEMVEAGLFRKDLFYRLNVVQLKLPALRERKTDIPLLAQHFLDYFAEINQLNPAKFTNSALNALHEYHWPGNIRELRNLCERVSILFPGKSVAAHNLPADITTRMIDSPQTSLQLPEDGISLEFLESTYIQQALNRTRFNKAKSAKLLGISRDALLYRMKKYNIVYA